MDNATVRELIDAGIHFGHRVGRWNPKMKPYIFGARNSIHIIDIKETVKGLLRAKKFLTQVVSSGKDVLFVGTKRQARKAIEDEATRCGMHYVTERWLGGTLTNFRTIRSRLARLNELEEMETNGTMAAESKKMESTLRREMFKIRRNLDGVREMNRIPGAIILIDAKREHTAVREARKMGVPTVCLLDTDSDPDVVDIPIPGNDDAMRSIQLIVKLLADAVMEGKAGRGAAQAAEAEAADDRRPSRSRRMSLSQSVEAIASDKADSTAAPTTAGAAAASGATGADAPQAAASESSASPEGPDKAPASDDANAQPQASTPENTQQ